MDHARAPYPLHAGPSPHLDASRAAADAARRLIGALVGSGASVDELERAAREIDAVVRRLAPYAPKASRFETAQASGTRGAGDQDYFEYHAFIGPSSPLAPPMVLEADGERIVATVTYDHRHEGFAGLVHGGFLAAAFDFVLAAASATTNSVSMTGRLTVRYRKPTPIGTPLLYAGWIERADARKIVARGTVSTSGTLTAEAEGLFIVIPRDRVQIPDISE
jgi:acyl-coenzyme A thioesterase PaaI-like protein